MQPNNAIELEASPCQSTDPAQKRTGGQILMDGLVRFGVQVVFGYPGGSVIPLYDDMLRYRDRVRHILVRHEQGAIHAAEAYARVTGRPGVAIATSGPGATNMVTGMMNAHLDSVPMVVIGGQVPTFRIGTDAFQECDMMSLSNSITKHNFQPRTVDELDGCVQQAFLIATTGRPGPVYIDLPKDVQMGHSCRPPAPLIELPLAKVPPFADVHDAARAALVLRSAKRPLILAGHGVVHAEAAELLTRFARAQAIPVVTTILAKGVFDEADPLALGCVGMHGRRVANYAVLQSDVILALGCRFSDRVTGDPSAFAKNKRIIHVDIDHAEIGKNVPAHVGMHCDARQALVALSSALEGEVGQWRDWTAELRSLRTVCARCVPESPEHALTPRQVMNALNEVLDPEDVVTTGVGQHQMFASHFLMRRRPRTFVTSGGAGTMGFGLPAGVGAALAKPDARVWVVDGDGSIQMTVQELATVRETGARMVIVVLENRYLGMVRQWQEIYHERRYSAVNLNVNPDFVKLADAYGIKGVRVTEPGELRRALRSATQSDEPLLVQAVVAEEMNILPMTPPGKGLNHFFGNCIREPGLFFTAEERAFGTEI